MPNHYKRESPWNDTGICRCVNRVNEYYNYSVDGKFYMLYQPITHMIDPNCKNCLGYGIMPIMFEELEGKVRL